MSARGVVLGDALGPRGRRRVLVGSLVSGAIIAGLLALAVWRFAEKGQLDADQWEVFEDWAIWRFLLVGLRTTLFVFLAAGAITLVVAVLAALGRLARNRLVRWVAGLYVELFRAVPLLLLILFAAVALPQYGLDLPDFWYLVLALAAYNGAVMGEIFRAGILSLERGQTEAAYAVGLGYWPAMRLVVIPQAARRMTPAIISQLVTLLKDTSLGYVVAVEELLRRGRIVGEFGNNPLQALIVVAAMFIVVNFTLSTIGRRLEQRQTRRYGAPVAGGEEDFAARSAVGGGGGVGTPGGTI